MMVFFQTTLREILIWQKVLESDFKTSDEQTACSLTIKRSPKASCLSHTFSNETHKPHLISFFSFRNCQHKQKR